MRRSIFLFLFIIISTQSGKASNILSVDTPKAVKYYYDLQSRIALYNVLSWDHCEFFGLRQFTSKNKKYWGLDVDSLELAMRAKLNPGFPEAFDAVINDSSLYIESRSKDNRVNSIRMEMRIKQEEGRVNLVFRARFSSKLKKQDNQVEVEIKGQDWKILKLKDFLAVGDNANNVVEMYNDLLDSVNISRDLGLSNVDFPRLKLVGSKYEFSKESMQRTLESDTSNVYSLNANEWSIDMQLKDKMDQNVYIGVSRFSKGGKPYLVFMVYSKSYRKLGEFRKINGSWEGR